MQQIKELESMRAMAQMLYEKADRLIKERQRPVSTGSCKKTEMDRVAMKLRMKTKARRLAKQQAQ